MARRSWFAFVLAAACWVSGSTAVAQDGAVLVFDAASLTSVIDDLSKAFTEKTHVPVKSSPAASSALAKQIEAGAPADVFFSADLQWMDYLDQKRLLKHGTRHDVVGNALVLIAPVHSNVNIKLEYGVDFGVARIATGDPDSVPVGEYAKIALGKLGAWDKVSKQLVRAENVRAALAFVARGEAPFGIVYKTDALAEKKVRIVAEFAEDTHPPIVYPIAVTTHGGATAQQFVDFVRSQPAREIFKKYGFRVPF